MNNEYIILSDDNIVVTDENGKMEKRSFNYKGAINEVLIQENKIEILDEKVNDLEEVLIDQRQMVCFSKNMIKLHLILLLASITFNIFSISMTGIIDNLALVPIVYCNILIFLKIKKNKALKEIKRCTNVIEQSKELKKSYINELEKVKQNDKHITNDRINIPMSLTDQNNIVNSQVQTDINNIYENIIKEKQKKLILKRNNNK